MQMIENCCVCLQKTSLQTDVEKSYIGSPPILISNLLMQCLGSPEKLKEVVREGTTNYLCSLCEAPLQGFYEASQKLSMKRNEFINRISIKSPLPNPEEYLVIIEVMNEDSNLSDESIEIQSEDVEEFHLDNEVGTISEFSNEVVALKDDYFVKVNHPDESFEDDWSSDWSNETIGSKPNQGESLLSIERIPKTKFRFCWRCEKNFPSDDAFAIHLKRAHKKNRKSRYSCNKCKQRFWSEGEFKAHISGEQCYSKISLINQPKKAFYNAYTCSNCSKTIPTQRSYQRHMTLCQPDKNDYSVCGNILSSNDFVQKHILVHKNISNFVCPVCDFKFKTAWNLKRHQKLHCLGKICRN